MSDLIFFLSDEEDEERWRGRRVVHTNIVNEPAAVAPQFSSAEIGNVNASTVVVTFDQDVTASNYATGVTIKVGGVSQTISSATRQANHAVVHYVIPVLWHGSGDSVTWEYTGGNIAGESGGASLETVTAQAVTNNVGWVALLDLQADQLGLSEGAAVATWADQSGNNRNFTQGTAGSRPTFHTDENGGYIKFDGTDDFLSGPNFADNLSRFAVFSVAKRDATPSSFVMLGKINGYFAGAGWMFHISYNFDITAGYSEFIVENDVANDALYLEWEPFTATNWNVFVGELTDLASNQGHLHINGSTTGENNYSYGTVTNYSNSENVRIGTDGFGAFGNDGSIKADMIIQINSLTNWSTDRAALEARLADRYGITL